jgi:hypothetical protein
MAAPEREQVVHLSPLERLISTPTLYHTEDATIGNGDVTRRFEELLSDDDDDDDEEEEEEEEEGSVAVPEALIVKVG